MASAHNMLRARLQREISGLTVAFLDGTYNAAAFHAGPGPSAVGSPYYTEHDLQVVGCLHGWVVAMMS